MTTACPACGLEVRLAQPWPPDHTPYWRHRQDPPDGHTADLPVPPRPKREVEGYVPPPAPQILEQRDATEAEMPPSTRRIWEGMPSDARRARYALARLPKGAHVESIGIRAGHQGRAVAVVWERRPDSPNPKWSVTMCRAWEAGKAGSYRRLPVVKVRKFIQTGEV